MSAESFLFLTFLDKSLRVPLCLFSSWLDLLSTNLKWLKGRWCGMSSVVSTRNTFFDEIPSPDSAKSLAGKNCGLEVWQHIESSGHLKSGTDWNPSCWNTSCEHVNPIAGLFSFLSGNLFMGERMVLKILEIKFRRLSPFSLKTCHILAQLHYVLPCLGLVSVCSVTSFVSGSLWPYGL